MIINKNFSNLLFGRLFVNMGDSLYYITIMWLVFELTQNTLFTGIAGALFMLPEVFSFFYGPIIDRCDKKRFLIIFTLLQTLLMLILYVLYFSGGDVAIYSILFIIPFLAFLSEFTYPIENALIPGFVGKEDLTKANSIMAIAADGVDLLFNAVSGILIAVTSIASILLGNAVLFLLAAVLFLRLKIKEKHQDVKNSEHEKKETYFTDLKEGLKFVKKKEILALIIPFLVLNLLLATFTVNLPAISTTITGSVISYGILLTVSGIGSVVGAIISNFISKNLKMGAIVISTVFFYGLSWLIGISLGGFFIYIFSFVASIFIGIINVVFTVIFQELPPENMLGRVNTTIKTLITIFMPIGALLGGWLPTILGLKNTIIVNASLIIILALLLLCINSIRNMVIDAEELKI
ncbi:MFS transporter [Lysinibacillus sp. JNUCC 51]|uniref:MFS transporter n=1 Tax=Lysinibacillus sp. JNUCC-51 TaxID=2792479 RepID=UPI001938C5CA|nr:MFS transporter [Lysinibacillus sp. JNUCC-51]